MDPSMRASVRRVVVGQWPKEVSCSDFGVVGASGPVQQQRIYYRSQVNISWLARCARVVRANAFHLFVGFAKSLNPLIAFTC